MRLFTCIQLEKNILESLDEISGGVDNVRWTSPDNRHLTLNFIGEVRPSFLDEITESLSSFQIEPFELNLKGVGTFFQKQQAGVIYAGVTQNKSLIHLQKKARKSLLDIGIPIKEKNFFPHITLGRFKSISLENLNSYISQYIDFHSTNFIVDGFYLMSSVLKPEGSVYTEEHYFPFQ